MEKLQQAYEVPITTSSPITISWLEKLGRKYAKLFRWFITVCEQEGWDFVNAAWNFGTGLRRLGIPEPRGVLP